MNSKPTEFHASILKLEDALVANDKIAALSELKRLAELGHGQSYAQIGSLYEFGNDRIAPRLDLAFDWYSKGAYEEIDRDGYYGMARFYFGGMHVERDLGRAVELFREAAIMGSVESAVMLGYCYLNGFGVRKNLAEAEKYLIGPSESGYVVAFYFLSRIAKAQRHYFRALRLWWTCISRARHLTIHDPMSPKLFYLHGAWKL